MNYLQQKQTTWTSYKTFLQELEILLHFTGVSVGQLPVTTGFDERKNWESPSDRNIKQKIGKVVIYIEENLTKELSLQKLADEINLSKYQLIRGFRREEGTTPWKFLMQKRIDNVKDLLEKGIPPGQAAVESGFYDQSHMNKAFREATGQTPKEYQEKNFRNRN